MTTDPNEIEAGVTRDALIKRIDDYIADGSEVFDGEQYRPLSFNILSDVRSFLSAASARGVADGWQPIETMPSDKWVFVYVPGVSGSGVEAIKKPDVSGAFWAGRIISLQTGREITRATHWRAAIRPPEGSPLSDNSLYAAPSSPAATPEVENGWDRALVAAQYRVTCSPHEWTDEDSLAMALFILKHAEAMIPAAHVREALARKLCEQHGGDPDAVASEPHDSWDGPLWTAFLSDADAILALFHTPPAPAGEDHIPETWNMVEADAEVERILAMSDEEVMQGVTSEEIAKMRCDTGRLLRTFDAGRRSGFIAGRDAAAGLCDGCMIADCGMADQIRAIELGNDGGGGHRNAAGFGVPVPDPSPQVAGVLEIAEKAFRKAWYQSLSEARSGWPGNLNIEQAWRIFKAGIEPQND